MSKDTGLPSLLSKRKIVLWVEDRLTREYLYSIWPDESERFNIMSGGGHKAVRGIVNELKGQKYSNVFGLTDRDFYPTNRGRWKENDPNLVIFRPERVEIENYLLDWDAMAGCGQNRMLNRKSVHDIKNRADEIAEKMVWWMACKSVLNDFWEILTESFPEHPKPNKINSLKEAEDYIVEQEWYVSLRPKTDQIINAPLSEQLKNRGDLYQSRLQDGSWVNDFSGKQIYKSLCGFVLEDPNRRTSEKEIDLAISIGEWQYKDKKIPPELIELKDALKVRVGI